MIPPALLVGWTLCFDILFYLAVGMSMWTGARPLIALYAVMLAGSLFSSAPIFDYFGNPLFLEFLFGAALARLPRDERLAIPLLLAAAILLALSPTWVAYRELAEHAPASAWRVLYWGVPAALLAYGCLCGERFFKHRAWDVLVFFGAASYSIYLFHLWVITRVDLYWVAELFLAIAVGIAAWWLIERPVIALKPKVMALALAPRRKALVPAE